MKPTSTQSTQPVAEANGPDCDRVNTILDQIIIGKAPSEEDEEYFINHAEDCSPCFDNIDKQRVFVDFLSQRLGRKEAPVALSHSILARVQAEMA